MLHGEPADPESLPLGTQGGIVAHYLFPYDGDYQITITGRDRILTVDGLPVSIDGGFVHMKAGLHQLGLTAPKHIVSPSRRAICNRLFPAGRFRATASLRVALDLAAAGLLRGRVSRLSVRSIPPASRSRQKAALVSLFVIRPTRAKKLPARPGFSRTSRSALSGDR